MPLAAFDDTPRLPTASQIEWRPFQKKILKIVEGEADDRAIHWFYSIQGKVGKSRVAKELVERYGALIIDPQKAKGSLELIRVQLEESEAFAEKPVLILDLCRVAKTQVMKLYETLESILGSFSDKEGTVTWPTPPHVIVFANDTPATGRLSADRLRVHLITSEHKLVRAKHIEAKLAAHDQRLKELQAQEEAAAESGETPARLLNRGSNNADVNDGLLVRRPPERSPAASPTQESTLDSRSLAGGARRGAQASVGPQRPQPRAAPLPPRFLRAPRVVRAGRVGALWHGRGARQGRQEPQRAGPRLSPGKSHRRRVG